MPIDPAIRSWVTEAGLHQDGAWVWLGMIGRTFSSGEDSVCFDMVYHHPAHAGAFRSLLQVPRDSFGREWDGYRIELLGGVRRLRESGFQIEPTPRGGPQGPTFKVMSDTDEVWIEVELWRQRCYRPGPDRQDIPALVAEAHWWPGLPIAHPFFRVMADDPNQLSPDAVRAARKDWALLQDMPLTVRTGGAPTKDRERVLNNLADLGLKWLKNHPDYTPADVREAHLAEAAVTNPKAIEKRRSRPKFGKTIGMEEIRQRIAELMS